MNLSKPQAKALADKLHYDQEQATKLQYDQRLKNKKHPDFVAFMKTIDAKHMHLLFGCNIVKEVRLCIQSATKVGDYEVTVYKGESEKAILNKINASIVSSNRYNRNYNYDRILNAIILATIDCESTDKLIAAVKKQLGFK